MAARTPKEIIESFVQENIKLVSERPDIAESQFGTESESAKDYSGRVVYEFFQNAVDRSEKYVWIDLTENRLVIANDGKPFSIYDKDNSADGKYKKSDFHALNTIHNSNKKAGEAIGNKGVGFKSCWNVSQHVTIESKIESVPWGFELFNPVEAEHFRDEVVKDVIGSRRIPSFYFPQYVESSFNGSDAVTRITIDLKNEESHNELKSKIESFGQSQLFFLNYLQGKAGKSVDVHLTSNGMHQVLSSSTDKTDWILVDAKSSLAMQTSLEELKVIDFAYSNKPDEPNIAIAFPPKGVTLGEELSKFYTYLPTELNCGFNVLIHADFALDNARVSIPKNEYNDKLLEIAATLFVEELNRNSQLWQYPNFADFLMPNRKGDLFAQKVWKKLTENRVLTEILKKVYTKETSFSEDSYEKLMRVVQYWTPHKTEFTWRDHYQQVYRDCLQYFCHEEVFCVYVSDDAKTFLPIPPNGVISTDDEAEFGQKLFFVKKDEDGQLLASLSELSTLSITSSETLNINKDIFEDLKIVRDSRGINIVRALAHELEKQFTTEEQKMQILKYIATVFLRENQTFNNAVFEKDQKKRNASIQYHLSRIYLPVLVDKEREWRPARECFFGIEHELTGIIEGFYQVDIQFLKELFNDVDVRQMLHGLGAWSVIPVSTKEKSYQLPIKSGVKLTKNFSDLLKKTIEFWAVYVEPKSDVESYDQLKEESRSKRIFFDEYHDEWCSPDEVFLFSDDIVREGIFQAKKSEGDASYFVFFGIQTIEETSNADKLVRQLFKLKNFPVTKSHKTLYKQLISSLSKGERKFTGKDIPLLTENKGYAKCESYWFADRDNKRYKYLFETDLDFVLFDIETSQDFVKQVGCNVFDPIYELRSKHELSFQTHLKEYIQTQYLPEFFCLAEDNLSVHQFNKEQAIARWNNLKIGYAEDVWIEVKLKSSNMHHPKMIGHNEHDKDVLFKPLTRSERQQDAGKVGQLVHDLKGDVHEMIKNTHFAQFGYAIADGVFRNVVLGSLLSDFLRTPDRVQFLRQRGILDSDISEMRKYLSTLTLNDDEHQELAGILNQLNEVAISKKNWHELSAYLGAPLSFSSIQDLIDRTEGVSAREKFKQVISVLNPETYNQQQVTFEWLENIRLKLFFYQDQNKTIEEIKEALFNKLKASNAFFKYDFGLVDCLEVFQVGQFTLTEIEKEQARVALTADIGRPASVVEVSNATPIKKAFLSECIGEVRSVKRTEADYIHQTIRQQKTGLGYERNFALEQVKKLVRTNKHVFQELYNELNLKNKVENIDLLSATDLADIIQVSKSEGDGLGYDVIEIVLDPSSSEMFLNKVEIKSSSSSNNTIHFSANEIEKIKMYLEDPSWKLYHFTNGYLLDRTDVIKNEVANLYEHVKSSFFEKTSLSPDGWVISF